MSCNVEEYLKTNYSHINVDDHSSFLGLSIMDNDLSNKEIFLTGENHGVKANIKLRMKFLKYFKAKTDFIYYLCELPYSIAYFLNIFLETGDEEILARVYGPLLGTHAWNRDDYEHWLDLYQFNKALAHDRKIKVIGVDIDHQLESPYTYMDYIINKKNILRGLNCIEGLGNIMKEFKFLIDSRLKINNPRVKDLYERLNNHIEVNHSAYKNHLKDGYFGFKFVCNNLLSGYISYSGNNFNSIRDSNIYNNFLLLHSLLPRGKYFGQWGLSHIFQTPSPNVKWFGAALNSQNPAFEDKVLSIPYIYSNCKYLYPTTRKNYISSINTLNRELTCFEKFIKKDYTIFKLNNNDSPFNKNLIWPFDHIHAKKGVTTDYFQYLVIVQNSGAADELGGL